MTERLLQAALNKQTNQSESELATITNLFYVTWDAPWENWRWALAVVVGTLTVIFAGIPTDMKWIRLVLMMYVISEHIDSVLTSTYYCIDGETQIIQGQTQGTIKTRLQENGFYGNNLLCSWKIVASENKFIKLDVDLADLQWSPQYTTCSGYDNLQIVEGESIEGKSLASVCGARNPYNIITKGQSLFLQFFSTHQNFGNRRGVEITFHIFENNTCAPGWFQGPWDEDYCLFLGTQGTSSWTGSQDRCKYSQSNLVSISDEAEYQTIYEIGKNLSLSDAWIGLSDTLSEGSFRWLDTSSYPIIRALSGNNYRKHCVSISFDKLTDEWNVHNCERTLLNYICKAKKDGSTVLYSAKPASGPPDEVEESNNKTFLIVIFVIGGLIFIAGLSLFICCCVLKRDDRPCKFGSSSSKSNPQSKHEEPMFDRLEVGSDRVRSTQEPSAPPNEEIMLHDHDPQQVAPPTYDESLYHPVAPACY